MSERDEMVAYLVGRGWKQADAEMLADHGHGTMTYASARFNMTLRHFGLTMADAIRGSRAMSGK